MLHSPHYCSDGMFVQDIVLIAVVDIKMNKNGTHLKNFTSSECPSITCLQKWILFLLVHSFGSYSLIVYMSV